jgi:hypothetical protein
MNRPSCLVHNGRLACRAARRLGGNAREPSQFPFSAVPFLRSKSNSEFTLTSK